MLCKRAFRNDFKHFNPPRTASGWPCKFGSSLCSNRAVLAQRCSGLSPGPRESLEKSVAHSMHTNAWMCCKVLHLCSLQLVRLTVGCVACHFPLLYNKVIKRHNITSEVQRWHRTQENVRPESCVQVLSGKTMNQFNEKHRPDLGIYCPRAVSSFLSSPRKVNRTL